MRILKAAALFAIILASLGAAASPDDISGTWRHVESSTYFSDNGFSPPPEYRTVQIVGGAARLSPMCDISIQYQKGPFGYNDSFQMALKGGADEKSMGGYLKKKFNFDLMEIKNFYAGGELTKRCAIRLNKFFVLKNRLIFFGSAGSFDRYDRSNGGSIAKLDPMINLYGRKLSHLPYRSDVFNVLCADLLPKLNYVRQGTDKCGPVYFPYVATKADTDPLARLIGAHTYKKSGSDAQKDYDNPVAHNLHPVYMLLPPLKDVIVAVVEDLEIGDTRPGMAGVFLSIKDGKVVDQITASCTLGEDHSCVDGEGKKVYQLRDSGKFERITK